MIKKRRWVIAFGPTIVPPDTCVIIVAQPGLRFKAQKLILAGDTPHRTGIRKQLHATWCRFLARFGIVFTEPPGSCYIAGLFVGSKTQLPTFNNPISVNAFSPGLMDNELQFDSTLPWESITIQVQNTGNKPRMISFSMFGCAALESIDDREAWWQDPPAPDECAPAEHAPPEQTADAAPLSAAVAPPESPAP